MATAPHITDESLRTHPVVSREEWLAARKELLAEEKRHLREWDALAAKRRALPWVKVTKSYRFRSPDGEKTLGDLFNGRSQLFVYHFMLAPDDEHLCDGCCFVADHVDAARRHFEHNDLAFVAISRGGLDGIAAVRKRMGWTFPWVSSGGTDFNYDYGVSFTPEQVAAGNVGYNFATSPYAHEDLHGISLFYRNPEGDVFHTYSTYARGSEVIVGAYRFLDLAPKGRNEREIMDWVRHHDRYGESPAPCSCKH